MIRNIVYLIIGKVPIIGSLVQIAVDPLRNTAMKDEFYNEWEVCDRNKVITWMKNHYNRSPTMPELARIIMEKSK